LGWVPCRVARTRNGLIGIALRPDMAARHRLIRLLFSEPAHNIAYQGSPRVAIAQLLRRAFAG
jgi:cellulose synthase (UDP-forming)